MKELPEVPEHRGHVPRVDIKSGSCPSEDGVLAGRGTSTAT